ncbi:PTS sugar transporter subunit IIA [Salibacterium aidingense]|uniref:PTS sugar transporter subunit IIA n=1 Tax=Salibacterium aidingense TaxID=384933 RepID=UPI0003F904B8|nr:fructose PTS transporter subunit IIA [Salibacterium aidingense]
MEIDTLVQEDAVSVALKSTSRAEALEEMVDLLPASALQDKNQCLEDIQKREQEGSTGIGFGFAIPHGKSNGVQQAAIAIGKTEEGLEWESLDGKPVEVIFLIAVPEENAGDDHLKILQQLSRKMMDETFRDSLKGADTKKQIVDIVSKI